MGVFASLHIKRWIPFLHFSPHSCFANGRNYLQWMMQPDHAASEISTIYKIEVRNAVLAGQWAPELVLENRLRAIPVWKGFVNSEDPFKDTESRTFCCGDIHWVTKLLKFREWYPENMKKIRAS